MQWNLSGVAERLVWLRCAPCVPATDQDRQALLTSKSMTLAPSTGIQSAGVEPLGLGQAQPLGRSVLGHRLLSPMMQYFVTDHRSIAPSCYPPRSGLSLSLSRNSDVLQDSVVAMLLLFP